ncbi:MAG: hypothetical protein LBF83_09315 [Spirochaetaceae bacterium]|jgi:hypothetical protein|nr:hypothetical protein [Spirochaetaceae bacterium]
MSQQLDRFVVLLENIFEFKKSDLDFGIYRILNIRRKEILQFLREDLPARVKAVIAPDAEDREKLKAEKAGEMRAGRPENALKRSKWLFLNTRLLSGHTRWLSEHTSLCFLNSPVCSAHAP